MPKTIRILAAEDDLVSRRLLENVLRNWGYDVLVAQDGQQAWEVFQHNNVQLAILDWMMPKIDGIQLCRKIRQAKSPSYIYIILLTAKGCKEDIVKGLDAGADDYVTKPFDHAELRSRIQVGKRVIDLQNQLATKVKRLQNALAQVKQLRGLLPICMFCKKIRDDKNYWEQVENYIAKHSGAKFSHSICPDCMKKYYPEAYEEQEKRKLVKKE